QRLTIEGDAARAVCLGLERAQDLAVFVADEVSLTARALVDDPQAVLGRLQPVRLGARRVEGDLNLACFTGGNLAEAHGGRRVEGGSRGGQCEKIPAFHTGVSP